ncbi:macro domain-containing protein [Miniphocaeibacter massiliensis]|uniref:macro domain-containing protein n=1 Tax=Miniphocaeibacter massiliensis TaxID=2041841 RepID=UPI000C0859EE|nr:macro domain-containing protein [Miniphocaeibacter massiliensis]
MDIRFTNKNVFDVEADAILYFTDNSLIGEKSNELIEKAGNRIIDSIQKLNGCATGDIKIVPAFNLRQLYIILSVLPEKIDTNIQKELFNNVFIKLFKVLEEYELDSVVIDVSYMQRKYGVEYSVLLNRIVKDKRFNFYDNIVYMSK